MNQTIDPKWKAVAEELLIAQARTNRGLGSCTVRSIAEALLVGDLESAQREYTCDADKLTQYPELLKLVEKHFGCRAHLQHDCQKWLCRKL